MEQGTDNLADWGWQQMWCVDWSSLYHVENQRDVIKTAHLSP